MPSNYKTEQQECWSARLGPTHRVRRRLLPELKEAGPVPEQRAGQPGGGSAAGGRRHGARNLCGGPVERGLRHGAGRSEGNLWIFKPSQVVPVAAFAFKTKSEDKTKVGCGWRCACKLQLTCVSVEPCRGEGSGGQGHAGVAHHGGTSDSLCTTPHCTDSKVQFVTNVLTYCKDKKILNNVLKVKFCFFFKHFKPK